MKICLSCEGVTETQARRCGNCSAPLLSTDEVHYPARRGELAASNPLLGTVIDGKYRLQSVLGRGGLGTVFRAQHTGSLATVALKVLHPRFAQQPEYRRALVPEARRAAAVVHERCARLLDVGEGDEGITYLAMELVEGQTLQEVLEDGPLEPGHAVDILSQVAVALSAVHDAGLVHCDLSPRNVMVSARRGALEVKVLDFGIARSVNLAEGVHAPAHLRGFANPAFSAPELLKGDAVDARADVYSFGTLAWLALTGTMPVDDRDPRQAVEAIREGRLLPWPGDKSIPRRRVRLVRRCLQLDPAARPSSMRAVTQELLATSARRAAPLARFASLAAAAALVVALLPRGGPGPVFLRPQAGSARAMSDGALARGAPTQELRAEQLETIEFHFAGVRPDRLVAEVARAGKVLVRTPLAPTVDPGAGTMVLSDGQPSWREVLAALAQTSQKGPVELTLVQPGAAVLGAARLRLDLEPPQLSATFEGDASDLRRSTRLLVEAQDDLGVTRMEAQLRFASGEVLSVPLPTDSGPFALGEALAASVRGVAPLGAGAVVVTAADAAGHRAESAPVRFVAADVAAPRVTGLTGPAGRAGLARIADRLRFRVQLSAGEPGLRLRCRYDGGELQLPLKVESTERPVARSFDVAVASLSDFTGELEFRVAVIDPLGNEEERVFAARVVDHNPELVLEAASGAGGRPTVVERGELVTGPDGGAFVLRPVGSFDVAGAFVERDGQRLPGAVVELASGGAGDQELRLGALRPGAYSVRFDLAEREAPQFSPVRAVYPLRVLPERVTVQVPRSDERFLPALLEAGVLSSRVVDGATVVGEGVAWRYDRELRPYVRGVCFGGGRPAVTIRARQEALLGAMSPQRGWNQLALELFDALGRRVGVVDREGRELESADGRVRIARVWWRQSSARPVGEQQLVEHGKPVRLRILVPLPLETANLGALVLGLGNGEWPAVSVEASSSGSEVRFEVPFSVWSVSSQLAAKSRRQYADGLEAVVSAYVLSPDGRDDLQITLRTTRSTLAPLRLGDVAATPPGLADMQLLPVLGPDGAFEEPMPERAPPRTAFRPQPATPVRDMPDILLQDREVCVGEVRSLSEAARPIQDPAVLSRLVHRADPLGGERLSPANLLPAAFDGLADDRAAFGLDFFQAWALSRLLGHVVAGDPEVFRLPLGCELERAAFADGAGAACSGVLAQGGEVSARAFDDLALRRRPWGAVDARAFGDVVPTAYGASFVGLDFGLREWVLDLPHVPGAELLLREWTGIHAVHLARALASGAADAQAVDDPTALQQHMGVGRGLALGERAGVIGFDGERLPVEAISTLPPSVPGVLRTEQLRRDGRAMLGTGRDARLRNVGFRVACDVERLPRTWGYR